jgi:nitrogen fixation/metabolism regulation signal transduction histidine kinase
MSTKNFDLICDTVDNGVIILDKDLTVHFWNVWLQTRTHITQNEILGQNIASFFPDINIKTLQRKITTALTLNTATFYNTRINKFLLNIHSNKVANKVFENMRQSVTITPLDRNNQTVMVYIYDDTLICESNHKLHVAKHKVQNALDEKELLLNTIMEAIFVFEDEKCTNCNDMALKLFEYKHKEEIYHKRFFDFIDKTSNFLVHPENNNSIEVLMSKANGKNFPALIKTKDATINNKTLKILTVMDISELKTKDKLLAEQTKMAALGEMIGNIAHQWRQPLSTISTAASGLKLQKEFDILNDEIFDEAIEGIIRNSQHLSQTINDFQNFLKGDKEKTLFNLKEHLKKDLKIVEGMLKNECIEIVLDCEDNIDIFNFPNEFTQAFINLLNNAKDAFIENIAYNDPRYIFINAYLEGTQVYLEVTDNAKGIPNEIISKIFEPYFTTKHSLHGTGLGLYMTHELIHVSMGGNISVSNKTYRYNNITYTGASFLITLPL